MSQSIHSLTQEEIYKAAVEFYNAKQKEKLERLFAQYLKNSYDSRLWKLYLQHTKNLSLPHNKMMEVFDFILHHFEHAYDAFDFVIGAIEHIDQSDESDSFKAEQVRRVYHQFLKVPMENLTKLWLQYEAWELSINRLSARTFTESVQPAYLSAHTLYQKAAGFLKNEKIFELIDLELENLMKLSKSQLDGRLSYVFSFLSGKTQKTEIFEILKTIYIGGNKKFTGEKEDAVLEKHINTVSQDSSLLSIWFSFFYKRDFFNFKNTTHINLIFVNYLLFAVQNKGVEEFRRKFEEIKEGYKEQIDFHVFLKAAEIEYMYCKSDCKGFDILMDAIKTFGDSSLLNEASLDILLRFHEEEKAVLFFKKAAKTRRMYDMIAGSTFKTGDLVYFTELLLQKESAIKNQEILKNAKVDPRETAEKAPNETGSKAVLNKITKTLEYLDLTFSTSTVAKVDLSVIPSLPYEENFVSNINLDKLIEILQKS
ncbi:RNA14 [Ecytonucleospora hepatopenaei]|uniref:RNA14 n=1 Tax=Ecytonucleospora hepatopenaei TaxID=646526 RepID=A0A1W0E325_9MICR|nr:RNA14 [Ecytonucleospora hepatopenaei]